MNIYVYINIHMHINKREKAAGHQWLLSVILLTWETEIGRMWFKASAGK
jgi:hypothetical protein